MDQAEPASKASRVEKLRDVLGWLWSVRSDLYRVIVGLLMLSIVVFIWVWIAAKFVGFTSDDPYQTLASTPMSMNSEVSLLQTKIADDRIAYDRQFTITISTIGMILTIATLLVAGNWFQSSRATQQEREERKETKDTVQVIREDLDSYQAGLVELALEVTLEATVAPAMRGNTVQVIDQILDRLETFPVVLARAELVDNLLRVLHTALGRGKDQGVPMEPQRLALILRTMDKMPRDYRAFSSEIKELAQSFPPYDAKDPPDSLNFEEGPGE